MPDIEIGDSTLLTKIIGLQPIWVSELELTLQTLRPDGATTTKIPIDELRTNFEHPLDDEIVTKLKELKKYVNDNIELYRKIKEVRELWALLIEKSVKALRFFDEREPYQTNKDKKPIAYGIENLKEYFEKYADFEGLLYGSNKSYRDHVLHVFRSWLVNRR